NLSVVNGNDQTALTVSSLSAGTHSLLAVYSGDSNFGGSSGTWSQTVQKAGTTTSLGLSSATTLFGQAVTFTATVSVTSPGAGTPTGSVTFYDGSTALGTGALDGSGVATFQSAALGVGAHSLTAHYNGASNFNGSTSSSQDETVQKASTTTALALSPAALVFG